MRRKKWTPRRKVGNARRSKALEMLILMHPFLFTTERCTISSHYLPPALGRDPPLPPIEDLPLRARRFSSSFCCLRPVAASLVRFFASLLPGRGSERFPSPLSNSANAVLTTVFTILLIPFLVSAFSTSMLARDFMLLPFFGLGDLFPSFRCFGFSFFTFSPYPFSSCQMTCP